MPGTETAESLGGKSDCFALEINFVQEPVWNKYQHWTHLSPVFCDDLVCPCVFPCASLCPCDLTVHEHRALHVSLHRTRVRAGQANLGQGEEEELEGRRAGGRAWGWCAER